MRLSSLLFFVGSLLGFGTTNALTTYYATQGFTPPGGCASSTAGALNVVVSLPVPAGAIGLQIKEVAYALRGTTTQPGTMTISANGVTASANPANAYLCCSANYCDLATYTISQGSSWYESTCGNPQCGTAQQWYRLPFNTGWYVTNGANSIGIDIQFGGAGVSLANFGSGSSFFVSYYANFPSPSPTPTPSPRPTLTPTSSPSASASSSITVTSSISSSPSASVTPSSTVTSSISSSPSVSITPSSSITSSLSPSVSSTSSSSPSVSITPSRSITPSSRPTPSPSASSSPSVSPSSIASSTASPSATKSILLVSSPPKMSDFSNSTASIPADSEGMDTATILSGTTVGITGIALLTYVLNYLRRSGALNFLRAVGVPIPINTTAKTEEEKRAEAAGAETALGKAAEAITKIKNEKDEILKVVDSLPLPEQLKYAAHNPRSILSKSGQSRLETAERDLEKALPVKKILNETIPNEPPKMSPEAIQILQQCADQLGIKIPAKVLQMTQQEQSEQLEEIEEEYTEALEESKQEIAEPAQVPRLVTPEVVAAATTAAKKVRAAPGARATQAKKATLEVNEAELAEIKLILANKKKAFNVV